MLMQALDFFVWKVPSIWLDIDKLQDHQFWPVELSMATRMRRFCGGLSHRHPGGALPAGFARPCSRIIAPWHSPASMLLERTPQRANCHLTRACACCLQEFPRVASAQWVPVEHWTCGGGLALPSCSVDLRILAHVGLRRRLSCVLASFDTHF